MTGTICASESRPACSAMMCIRIGCEHDWDHLCIRLYHQIRPSVHQNHGQPAAQCCASDLDVSMIGTICASDHTTRSDQLCIRITAGLQRNDVHQNLDVSMTGTFCASDHTTRSDHLCIRITASLQRNVVHRIWM